MKSKLNGVLILTTMYDSCAIRAALSGNSKFEVKYNVNYNITGHDTDSTGPDVSTYAYVLLVVSYPLAYFLMPICEL